GGGGAVRRWSGRYRGFGGDVERGSCDSGRGVRALPRPSGLSRPGAERPDADGQGGRAPAGDRRRLSGLTGLLLLSRGTGIRKKTGKAKRLIKTHVEVHDRTQLETVFDYFIRRGGKSGTPDKSYFSYEVDAFFFVPNQLGVDPTTYPKERF